MHRIPARGTFVCVIYWSVAGLVLAESTFLEADWAVHRWAGYVVLSAVALRLAWGSISLRNARLRSHPLSLQAAWAHPAGVSRKRHLYYNPLGALIAYNLWASLIAVCATGILMTTRTFWGVEWIGELHQTNANWMTASAVLYVATVAFEAWYSKVRLVRAMIFGSMKIPGPGA